MVGVVFLRGEFETSETFACVPVGMVHFGEIVIFGGEPEDRNRVGALLCDCVRPTERGDRFIDAVGGTRKEADLLARNDRDCACGETIEIPGCFGRKLRAVGEARILFAQDFYDCAASFRVETDFLAAARIPDSVGGWPK